MKKISIYLLACMLIAGLGFISSSFTKSTIAKPDSFAKWEKLGERKVNYTVDRDEIAVGAKDGFFDALKLKIRKGAINMHKMVVHFGNGEEKEFELRNNIPAGGESRVLDLPGNNRVITKVVFWYDTKNRANRRAEVELWGRH